MGPASRPGIDRLSIDRLKGFLQRIEVGLAGCLAGEVGQQSLEHELAAAEHGRLVAEPTYVGHVVRNEDRRLALGLAAENNFVEQLAGRQIHAFGRLVEHQQLGIVDQGLSQGQAAGACPCCRRRWARRRDRPGRPRPGAAGSAPPGPAASAGKGRRSMQGKPGPSSTAERPGSRAGSRLGPACRDGPEDGPAAGSFPRLDGRSTTAP